MTDERREEVVNPEHAAGEGPGESIGGYRLLEELGEGGFGRVHAAEQIEPVRRTVALKILKPGMDSKSVLARFEAERQALALMDHPAIASMLDAGTTSKGRPFFVMELVRGAPITQFCDTERLGLKARLELFIDVCRAVEHAHTKGVIHRDLKPSNVLAARVDGRVRPKVIDFGIAKAVQGEVGEATLLTRTGEVVGTPVYMSPEQAELEDANLDTRSDVYSLGAMLYELLAGTPPFPADTLKEVGPLEALRRVREEEPPRPSTRADSRDTAARDGSRRSAGPGWSGTRLRGELDWIVMKALEKDRTRRYRSAASLAADLQRYLKNEPVEASPPSATYRLRKLASRHRGAAVGILAVLLGLVGSTAGVGKGLLDSRAANLELTAERRRAEENAHAARLEAERAERRADELGQLSDLKILGDLREQMMHLWPAYPWRIRELDDWLGEAEVLLERLPRHRQVLEELEARAIPGSSPPELEDPVLQWWHQNQAELVEALVALSAPDVFGSTVANVRERLAFAETVEQRSIDDAREEWDEAIASIASSDECPQYAGLGLNEQVGLVPIGRDPDSGLWEFWHLQSGARPERDVTGRFVPTENMSVVLVLIPGGSDWVGAQSEDPQGPNYDPAAGQGHTPLEPVRVTLDPYFVSKYEMTQAQWERCFGSNPSAYQPIVAGDATLLHPVEQISAEDSVRLLGQLDLTLPTEAQWEYACRAGTDTPWWTGRDPAQLDMAGNVADRTLGEAGQALWDYDERLDDGFAAHAPVGRFRANPFGLHDVIGNVWEQTLEVLGAAGEAPGTFAARGGGAYQPSVHTRSVSRMVADRSVRVSELGVRPARTVRTEPDR